MKRLAIGCTFLLLVGTALAQQEQTGFRLTRGKIESVDESTLKVKNATESTTLQAQTTTKITVDGKNKLADLKAGDEVTVIYSRNENQNRIREVSSLSLLQGKIQSIEENTLKVEGNGKTMEIKTSPRTQVSIADKSGKITELKTGDQVNVAYSRSNNTDTANYIEARRSN